MTWQVFVVAIVGALAWPAAVLVIAFIIRRDFEKVMRS